MTYDGKEYAPERFKDLVRERYIITKHTHAGYMETGDMTPSERKYLLTFIQEDLQRQQEAIERVKRKG